MKKREAAIEEHIRFAGFSYPDSVIHTFVGEAPCTAPKSPRPMTWTSMASSSSRRRNRSALPAWNILSGAPPVTIAEMVRTMSTSAVLSAQVGNAGRERQSHGASFLVRGLGWHSESSANERVARDPDARQLFISRKAALAFQGFANDQLARLVGSKGGGKHGQRPEYICKFGYDAKAAMHVIRLLNEGIEFIRHGTITLPRPEKDLLITIRTGGYGSLEKVTDLANKLFAELDAAREASSFPDDVDRGRINNLVADVYLNFYTGG